MPRKTKNALNIWKFGMFSSVFLCILVCVTLISKLTNLRENFKWIEHSYSIALEIEVLLKNLREIESKNRGYLLTKNQSFIDEFEKNKLNLNISTNYLIELTKDNPKIRFHFEKIKILVADKISKIEKLLTEPSENKEETSSLLINSKLLMEEIENIIKEVHSIEDNLLTKRVSKLNENRLEGLIITILAIFVVASLLILTIYMSKVSSRSLKQLETEIQTSQERDIFNNNLILEIGNNVSEIFWITDLKGSVTFFNKKWYEFTKCPEGKGLGTTWLEFLHPEDQERTLIAWESALKNLTEYEVEYRFKNIETGKYGWFLGRAKPVYNSSGQPLKWIGTCTNITFQKEDSQIKQQLLDSERSARGNMERSSMLKDEYLAIIAHELRGPINSISGWTQLLKTKTNNTTIIERALNAIEDNIKHQSQLISDLLDIQRIVTGKLKLEYNNILIKDVLDDLLEYALPLCKNRNINLEEKREEIDNLYVSGEQRRLKQVFINLLNNSIKFTPKDGNILIKCFKEAENIIVEIIDTGIGIEKQYINNIFQKYNQAEVGFGAKKSGLGIGLAIAKNIIEQHQGKIEVFSEGNNKGATFRVTIPTLDSVNLNLSLDNNSQTDIKSITSFLKHKRVLILEDNLDSREALYRILSGYEMSVNVASSGVEGLKILKQEFPDIIISDLNMPDIDGYTFMKLFREKYGTEIPSIALSALNRDEDIILCYDCGFDYHLEKPLNVSELIKSMYNLLIKRYNSV